MNAGTMTGYNKPTTQITYEAHLNKQMNETGATKNEVKKQDAYEWKDFGTDILDFIGIGTARRQREHELNLANTAYQRAVADMRAAGLNPAQMFAGGGHSADTTGYGSTQAQGLGAVGGVLNGIANVASSFNNDKNKNNNMNAAQAIHFVTKIIKLAK